MEVFKEIPFKIMTSDEMLESEFISEIISIFYGQLVPKLLAKFENDNQKVTDVLMEFGRRSRAKFTNYWLPKSKSVINIVKESYQAIMKRKLKKIITIEKNKRWIMVDDSCVMCWEGIEFVGNVHYCTFMAGVIEGCFDSLRVKEGFEHLPIVKAKTISSRACGDKDCRHEFWVVG
ncbi:MAG: hypothetical protein ACTSRW_14285 [Candidatus Helarchaeota archaeon]